VVELKDYHKIEVLVSKGHSIYNSNIW
jgi:hypothetical protein